MPGDFRREHELDELLVDVDLGMQVVQLVERGDDALPQRDVRLQQPVDQHLAARRGVPMRTSTCGSSRRDLDRHACSSCRHCASRGTSALP